MHAGSRIPNDLRSLFLGIARAGLLQVAADGQISVLSHQQLRPQQCSVGRRPPGLCETPPKRARTSRLGAFLADAARLEHASIFAFYQLIEELRAHEAPEALRLLVLEAMMDEVRHAREVGELANQYGAEVTWCTVERVALRSLFEIGLDNAAEGCVRETFGALLATYQAEHARDQRVRELMMRIAQDETRHATLSWKLMAWIAPRLSEPERAALAATQHDAREELRAALDTNLSAAERDALGLPSAELAGWMLAHMERALFS